MNDDQLLRYSRQILLQQIGIEGQQRLLAAHVLVIGLGGLGSPVTMYLAASGVGCLTLVDHDQVELTNLQRQIVHTNAALGMPKVESARRTLAALNPEVRIETINRKLDEAGLAQAVRAAERGGGRERQLCHALRREPRLRRRKEAAHFRRGGKARRPAERVPR